LLKIKEQYIVDQNGKKKAVILDITSYRALLRHMEKMEDALHLEGEARLSRSFSFIGSGASGKRDISLTHDEALAEDFA
jgi:hypothetical protein